MGPGRPKGGVNVAEAILCVAVGCGRLPGLLDAAAKHPFVVLGTMDAQALGAFPRDAQPGVSVYFYETG